MRLVLIGSGLIVSVGAAVALELDRRVARLVRIWRAERRRKARAGWLL
ncbi:MAG: hypothetical protein NUW01_16160 [Gemmatimonadaceae bacterium]|nr:hypothetical protein [Gemmatimonadaceae bacterium]